MNRIFNRMDMIAYGEHVHPENKLTFQELRKRPGID